MITLKSVKIYERLSKESVAFSATVYYDGRRAGEANNDGHGGSTWIHLDRATRGVVEAWALANVPPGENPCDGAVAYLVDNLVDAHAQAQYEAKETKRIARIDAKEIAALRARCRGPAALPDPARGDDAVGGQCNVRTGPDRRGRPVETITIPALRARMSPDEARALARDLIGAADDADRVTAERVATGGAS